MSKSNEMKPGKNGYKIVFATNTIVMNYKFAAAAAQYGTPEYKLMKKIRRDFPGMAEIVVSGRDKKIASPNTRFTYDNMKAHIRAYENADELLEVFKTVLMLVHCRSNGIISVLFELNHKGSFVEFFSVSHCIHFSTRNFTGNPFIIQMVIWHVMFNLRQKIRGFIKEKTSATDMNTLVIRQRRDFGISKNL